MEEFEFGRKLAEVAVRYARGDEEVLEEFLTDMGMPFRRKDRIYFVGRPGRPRTTLVPGDPVEVFVSLAYVFLGLTWFLGPVGQEGLRELCRLYTKEGE